MINSAMQVNKKNFSWSRKHEMWLVLGVIILAGLVRMYRINYPLGDWHSWRQADTASVTREYVKHGIDLLHPTYHDLSTIPNNLDNSAHGYRMVEFPFINASIALLLKTFPSLPLVATSRFVSNLFSLGTLISMYLLMKKIAGRKVALTAACIFAVLPYSIYYSRVILPEPYMLFFSTFSLFAFSRWTEKQHFVWMIASSISLALALLLKPFDAFLAPVYAGLIVFEVSTHKNKLKSINLFTFFQLGLYAVIAFLPLFLWRTWIAQYPEGIPASAWLFNSNGIRFRPAWFRWLGYERLTKLFLGYFGILFLPASFLPTTLKKVNVSSVFSPQFFVLTTWWLGIFLYFSIIATGNVQHDYYQVLMTPIVCITVAIGIWKLIGYLDQVLHNTLTSYVVSGVLVVLMLYFSWQQVKGYFNVNHFDYVEAGKAVDALTPPDAKVIAPALGDTQFLFQTNRTGWPIGVDIEDKIAKGATIYVSTNDDDERRYLESRYTVIEKTPIYEIIDLTKPTTVQ